LYDTPDDVVVVENSFGTIYGRDIHRLQKGEWLNDEILNYYLSMVRERSINPGNVTSQIKSHVQARPAKPLPKIFAFNTFFYSMLSGRGYSGVRRWTKKANINLFDLDRVIVPINKGGFHWILSIVNITEKRVEYYDSMGREGESNENRVVLTRIRDFMIEEAKARNQSHEEVAKWTFYVPVLFLNCWICV
jgi:sentrin-specific protease 1